MWCLTNIQVACGSSLTMELISKLLSFISYCIAQNYGSRKPSQIVTFWAEKILADWLLCISNQLGWKLLADETSGDWLWYLWTVKSAQPLKFCVIRQIIRFPLLWVSILYKLHYLCMPTGALNCNWIAMYIAKCTYVGLCISVFM